MSATGLDVFDETLQTTHTWLDELMEELGPDRQSAWHALGAVLRALRDRVPLELAAHLGAQLPLLIRGIYYDQWRPAHQPERYRSLDEFLEAIGNHAGATRPINPHKAAAAVFSVLTRHVPEGQIRKIRDAVPEDVRDFWFGLSQDAEEMGGNGPVLAHPEDVRDIRS